MLCFPYALSALKCTMSVKCLENERTLAGPFGQVVIIVSIGGLGNEKEAWTSEKYCGTQVLRTYEL